MTQLELLVWILAYAGIAVGIWWVVIHTIQWLWEKTR